MIYKITYCKFPFFFFLWCIILLLIILFKAKAKLSTIKYKNKLKIRDRTTSNLVKNINKTVGIFTQQIQRRNGISAISKNYVSKEDKEWKWNKLALKQRQIIDKSATVRGLLDSKSKRKSGFYKLIILASFSSV